VLQETYHLSKYKARSPKGQRLQKVILDKTIPNR